MGTTHHLTAVIEREGDLYVALCPELDIASQGDTVEESQRNLKEALELFFEEGPAPPRYESGCTARYTSHASRSPFG